MQPIGLQVSGRLRDRAELASDSLPSFAMSTLARHLRPAPRRLHARTLRHRLPRLVSIAVALAVAQPCGLPAQTACAPRPAAGAPLPGVDHDPTVLPYRSIRAVAWDPDGSGPEVERVVVGGSMRAAGGDRVDGSGVFDPSTGTWANLDAPPGTTSFFPGPNGELCCQNVDSSSHWSLVELTGVGAIGAGYFNGPLTELIWLPNGQVLAVGAFTVIDPGWGANLPASGLAVWNGVSWQPFAQLRNPQWSAPGNPAIGIPIDAQLLPTGDLIVSGVFTEVDLVPVQGIARWDGSQWDDLSGGPYSAGIGGQLALDGGLLLANVGVNAWTAWSGSGWFPYPALPGWTHSPLYFPYGRELRTTAGGLLLAVGHDGISVRSASGWGDLAWDNDLLRGVVPMQSGELFAVGDFEQLFGFPALRIVRLDLQGLWRPLGDGFSGPIRAVLQLPTGERLFGGTFTGHDGALSSALVRFDGSGWGDVVAISIGEVSALAAAPGGEALAIGAFQLMGSSGTQRIARVIGNGLVPLAPASFWQQYEPLSLVSDAAGSTWIGCRDRATGAVALAQWNGAALSSVSLTGLRGDVLAILPEAGGDLTLGGSFDASGTSWSVVRWDGAAWTGLFAVASGVVRALHREACGDLLVGGAFTASIPGNPIAFHDCGRWDGSQLLPVPAGPSVSAFAQLPNGDMLVLGRTLTRLHGSSSEQLAAFTGQAHDLVVDEDGTIEVVGDFGVAGGVQPNGSIDYLPSAYRLRLEPPCVAEASALGVGCAGPGGPITLTADTRPWIGTACEWRVDHVVSGSLVVPLLGLGSTSVPLSAVLPVAGAGCTILVTPDLLLPVVVAASGATDVRAFLAVPAAPSLVGQSLYLQALPVQIAGGLVGAGASNALQLSFGAL